MSRDQVIGALMLVGSVAGIVAYAWLVFFSEWAFLTIQASAFVAVAAVLGILAWIGYTLATTPPPKPIEEIEKELEEELKKLETEVKSEEQAEQTQQQVP